MKNNTPFLMFLMIVISLSFGCQGERSETPTKGHVTVVVSESVSPVIKLEEQTFEELYPEAQVDLEFSTTREAIARLFNDSITVIVTSRPL
ncbi:MAG TPA: substrate-binding domain-containing protein, partial [Bacteroidota bacterium]|nr:substrate-binding domain-containing protein [Bacteroidota bacterium]